MKSVSKALWGFYILASSIHLVTCYFDEYHTINMATKMALMPILMGIVISELPLRKHTLLLIGALSFSWLGDIMLMFDTDLNFLLGLGGFLVGHLFYIFTFKAFRDDNHEIPLMKRFPLLAALIAFAGLFVFLKIRDGLAEMELPVVFYVIIIVVMAITALNRHRKTTTKSFSRVMIGALLFMLSDSIIAWDMFRSTIEYASVCIMLTYCLAQGLIVAGLLSSKRDEA